MLVNRGWFAEETRSGPCCATLAVGVGVEMEVSEPSDALVLLDVRLSVGDVITATLVCVTYTLPPPLPHSVEGTAGSMTNTLLPPAEGLLSSATVPLVGAAGEGSMAGWMGEGSELEGVQWQR